MTKEMNNKELSAEFHKSEELTDKQLEDISGGIQAGQLLTPVSGIEGEFHDSPKQEEQFKLGVAVAQAPPLTLL